MTGAVLTATAKRRITDDWSKCFPNLGVAKPMWLMKRNGPILMGVCLDRTRSNDVYVPSFHVHNLLTPSRAVTLSLYRPLPDDRQPRLKKEIRVDRHETDFQAATDLLKRQVVDVSLRETTISRLIALYHEYIDSKRDPAIVRYPANLFADVITLAFWAGHYAYAHEVLDAACAAMRPWPPQEIDWPSWRRSLESRLDPVRLESTMVEEMERHGLENVPSYDLEVDKPPEPQIVEHYLAAARL